MLNIVVIPVSCSLVSYLGLACFPCPCPCPVSLVFLFFHQSMSVSLFCFDFVAPPPSVCFTLCIVYVWSSCCVYRNIDFLVLTLISCSRRQLSCPLSVYFDICDYLDSDLCLFYNDFCLAPLNLFFHFTVQLGPFLHFPFTPRNTCLVWVATVGRLLIRELLKHGGAFAGGFLEHQPVSLIDLDRGKEQSDHISKSSAFSPKH